MTKHHIPIRLVFYDWQNDHGKSVYDTGEGVELTQFSEFHHGSIFEAEIMLDIDERDDLQAALESGHYPVFYVTKGKDKECP